MITTSNMSDIAGKKYRDSMLDYPKPATHNIVFESKKVNRGPWDGKNVAFIGKVFSLWEMHDSSTLANRLQELCKEHEIEPSEIIVDNRQR